MTDKRKLNIVAGIAIIGFALLAGLTYIKMLETPIVPAEVYERLAFIVICFLGIYAIWIVRDWK